jgi:hypothetical protein
MVEEIIVNESMGDYTVPKGELVAFNKDGDYYDAVISNENDSEVSADSIVVTLEFKDDKVFDADATGVLDGPIAAHTSQFTQKACFTDPHFYAKPIYENKTVYVIDTEKYNAEGF